MRRELIQQAMIDLNLQSSTFANAIRVHQVSISKIIHEPSKNMGTSMAIKICGYLRLSMQDVFLDEIEAFRTTLPTLQAMVVVVQARKIERDKPNIISRAMDRLNISPAMCASLCGVTRVYMSILLGTPRTVSIRMAIKLSAILDITLDDIYHQELSQIRPNQPASA